MAARVNFEVKVYGKPTTRTFRNVFVLTTDDWDDFGNQCFYHLAYYDLDGQRAEIGTVKILQFGLNKNGAKQIVGRTVLPSRFEELTEDFISLGQGDGYYERLHELLTDEQCASVLGILRDIAWNPDLAPPFEPTTAFRDSLMRSNGAQRARRFGQALALGEAINDHFSFTYAGEIEGAESAIQVEFPFDSEDGLPGRVVGIIGRNAVGKTQFLATLAADLCQIGRSAGESEQRARDERFEGLRPLFTRVLAVSYSAFDRFARPRSVAVSYVYCGIRTANGGLSRKGLTERYRQNQQRIRELGRNRAWTRYIRDILGGNAALIADLETEIDATETEESGLALLSSGQSILVHFVTSLLAWLETNSLVLFDEPETHLHPNAVASLFNVLTAVLKEYESYAIIATHSPIVIQEIPAKRVVVFEREGNLTVAKSLGLESFGESIAELTRHVFETNEVQSLYRQTLRRLSQEEPLEATIARFDLELSLSAQAFLIAQHEREDQ